MLLDTMVLIWHLMGSDRLSKKAKAVIQQGGNFYSPVSLWELAIKNRLGRVSLSIDGQPVSARTLIVTVVKELQLNLLNLTFEDFASVESLETHHQDPFDHLLITQSKRNNLPIVSSDSVFDRYEIQRVW